MELECVGWLSGYLITFRTHGTWLPGDDRGSVDQEHSRFGQPYRDPDPMVELDAGDQMLHPVVILSTEQRSTVEDAIREVCSHRSWELFQLAVRTNHVHVVVYAPSAPEPVMNAFKSWSTRGLRAIGSFEDGSKPWARHGSTRYLWSSDAVADACRYVSEGQDGERFGDPPGKLGSPQNRDR